MKNVFAFIGAAVVVFGLLACGLGGVWLYNTAVTVNQIPSGVDQLVVTLDAVSAPQSGEIVIQTGEPPQVRTITETVVETVIVEVTAVPDPTQLPIAAPAPTETPEATYRLFDPSGAPVLTGPLTYAHVQLCRAIIANGNLDTLLEPQRSMCLGVADEQ